MKKFIRSLGFAWAGIAFGVQNERHMRIHVLVAAAVILLGAFLSLSGMEWALLLLTMALVIVAEMINTAVEKVVDLASPERHALAKTAKDVAAGAVLLAACFAVFIGFIILGPPLWKVITAGRQ
ncbi:diacylglycerol kinase family protein [Paenibacillus algorifonticola]|uniref:diacylglycerol kinase n=1 Tax=Paenibacillus algorifonticola TaxID=684063 RepID=UPI003D2C24CD